MSFFDYPTGAPPSQWSTQELMPDATEADWTTLLEFTQAERFTAGQTVLEAGGGGRSLYLLLEGSLEVVAAPARLGRSRVIQRLEPGAVIGEMAFFDGQPRSASVRALTSVVVAELTFDHFAELSEHHPDLSHRLLMDLGRILTGRLRREGDKVGS